MHFLVLSSGKPQYIYQLLMVIRVWRRNMRGKLYREWPSCPLKKQGWHLPNLEVETQQSFWKLQTGTRSSCLLSLFLNPNSYVSRDSTISPWWLLCQLVDSRSLRVLLYKAFIVLHMPQLQTLRQATCRDTGNHKEQLIILGHSDGMCGICGVSWPLQWPILATSGAPVGLWHW